MVSTILLKPVDTRDGLAIPFVVNRPLTCFGNAGGDVVGSLSGAVHPADGDDISYPKITRCDRFIEAAVAHRLLAYGNTGCRRAE